MNLLGRLMGFRTLAKVEIHGSDRALAVAMVDSEARGDSLSFASLGGHSSSLGSDEFRFWLCYHMKVLRFLDGAKEDLHISQAARKILDVLVQTSLQTSIEKGIDEVLAIGSANEMLPCIVDSVPASEVQTRWKAELIAKGDARRVDTVFPMGVSAAHIIGSSVALLQRAARRSGLSDLKMGEKMFMLHMSTVRSYPVSLEQAALLADNVWRG